ncbi:MAG: 4'-phosphopantetheinyl transferase superfamily protein [Spirochaetes bacterium]|nr:MAG: 4'-phosphopantetheinyl transferase superfamily protein [Spirochaetota bacterium]
MHASWMEMRTALARGRAVCVACGAGARDPGLLERATAMLNKAEAARLGGIRSRDKREEFLLSRLMVKTVAGALFEVDRRGVSLVATRGAPPSLAGTGTPEIHASLSHCPGAFALALTREHPPGVDIEPEGRVRLSIARRFFPPREYMRLAAHKDPVTDATAHWTLKEAYAKAAGIPLMAAMRAVSFCHEGGVYRIEDSGTSKGGDWSFESVRVLGGFRLSIAISGGGGANILEFEEPALLLGSRHGCIN